MSDIRNKYITTYFISLQSPLMIFTCLNFSIRQFKNFTRFNFYSLSKNLKYKKKISSFKEQNKIKQKHTYYLLIKFYIDIQINRIKTNKWLYYLNLYRKS